MTPPTRVLVLGVDAASPDLVERWTADGSLPHLAALMARGRSGRIRGLEGFHVGSTWPSFYTGTTPARHGLHYLRQLRPGTYDFYRPADHGLVKAEPFWRPMSRAGRRVAILDVPLTAVDPAINGIQTVEWGGHDSVYGFRTWPNDLAGQIEARYGRHPAPDSCDAIERTQAGYEAFVGALCQGAQAKLRLTEEQLALGGWDCFVQVFTESHCVGHQCWHLHDPAHPAHAPALAAALGDPLRRVYQAIDSAIGALVAAAGDACILVVSAHGMGHWYGAQFLMPDLLIRLGFAVPPPRAPEPGGRRLARGIWRSLPAAARRLLGPVRERFRAPGGGDAIDLGVDPAASRCFPHPNGLAVGGIRLNLRGREPSGLVAPGHEALALSEDIASELLRLVDDRTGRPIIRRVLRTAELYTGPCLDELPDLLVEWSDEVPTGSLAIGEGRGAAVRIRSTAAGVVEGWNRYGRTGEHRPDGWFVIAGPGLGVGRVEHGVSLLDFAPSLAALTGVAMGGTDGQVVPDLLT